MGVSERSSETLYALFQQMYAAGFAFNLAVLQLLPRLMRNRLANRHVHVCRMNRNLADICAFQPHIACPCAGPGATAWVK